MELLFSCFFFRLSNAESQLPFNTRRTCLDLIQRLLGRAPDVPLIEASSITSPLQEPIRSKPISVTKKTKVVGNGYPMNSDVENGVDQQVLNDIIDMLVSVVVILIYKMA